MRFVLCDTDVGQRVGILTERGVVLTSHARLEAVIDAYVALGPELDRLAATGDAVPADALRLLAPLPEPGKVLCLMRNFGENGDHPPFFYLKNPDAAVGPGGTLELPPTDDPATLRHEGELALVMRGPAHRVARDDWTSAVFGVSGFLDVTRPSFDFPPGRTEASWSKSFDTAWAIGPCVVTVDELDPAELEVRVNGARYETAEMEHSVGELVEFATTVLTLMTGDVIACGSHAAAVVPVAPGGEVELAISGIGDLRIGVSA